MANVMTTTTNIFTTCAREKMRTNKVNRSIALREPCAYRYTRSGSPACSHTCRIYIIDKNEEIKLYLNARFVNIGLVVGAARC